MTVSIIIPARLNSSRLPRKVLHKIYGLEMVEHVRRRASLCKNIDTVVVATCDVEIATLVQRYGGKAIMTSDFHSSGTSRAGEAIRSIGSEHVIVLQADEPLVLPEYLDMLAERMKSDTGTVAWNLVAALDKDELNDPSVVKCAVTASQQILYCFRRNPSIIDSPSYVRTLLGIHGYTNNFLAHLCATAMTYIESTESIEQMRILELSTSFMSVEVSQSLPSINTPQDLDKVTSILQSSFRQQSLIEQIL